jgi:predicted transposase YdaD
MIIADHIRAEEREKTMEIKMEFAIFQHNKGMLEKDLDVKFIADAVEMPIKEVRDIIQKIKDSSN